MPMLQWNEYSSLIPEMESSAKMGAYEVELVQGTWKGSAGFIQLFHLPERPEYSLQEFKALVHPEDFPRVMAYFERCLESESQFDTTYRCIINGRERFIETRTRIERDQNGKAIRLLGFKRDITEESQLHDVFRAAPSGMILVNHRREIVLLNKEIERIFQYSAQELAGQKIEVLLPERYRSEHPNLARDYMDDPVPRGMGVGRDLAGRRKDGSELPVEVGLHPIHRGKELFIICSVVDISERSRKAELEAKKKQELKDFAYRIGHDIRSPLANLRSLLSLSEGPGAGISLQESREMMSNITADLLQFTEDLIGVTGESPESADQETLNVDKLKRRIENRFQYPLIECRGSILWSQEYEQLPVLPPGVMEEILGNLISNALKYSHPDRTPEIRIVFRDEDQRFLVEVSDNGRGIPSSFQKSVFQLFERLPDQKEPGVGLGLYLVKKNLHRLNGHITFESNDKGTTFHIDLPLTRNTSH
ncbi:MAG: hypothetical protein CMN76_02270 [Spirochaetaceae bacterium]|nr:hypothetical protein [Spirochaetaceae bacterium]